MYLWIKLDEIRSWFDNSFGITFLATIISAAVVIIYTTIHKDYDGEQYPFSGCFSNDSDVKKDCRSKTSLAIKFVSIIFVIQLVCNIITLLLPSTKQMSVLYTLNVGVNSETFKSITSLDADIAAALKQKAKEWLKTESGIEVPENPVKAKEKLKVEEKAKTKDK